MKTDAAYLGVAVTVASYMKIGPLTSRITAVMRFGNSGFRFRLDGTDRERWFYADDLDGASQAALEGIASEARR